MRACSSRAASAAAAAAATLDAHSAFQSTLPLQLAAAAAAAAALQAHSLRGALRHAALMAYPASELVRLHALLLLLGSAAAACLVQTQAS